MKPYDYIHLLLSALGGEIKGRTRLQKAAYFVGLKTGNVEELGYRAHYYGPYSSDVTEAVDTLQALGFINETKVGGGYYDDRGFPRSRYDIKLTDDGKKIAEIKARQYSSEFEKIKGAVAVFNSAGTPDYKDLSIAAKAYFILVNRPGGIATSEELAQEAKKLGWDVSGEEIEKMKEFLQKLDLVSRD